MLDAAAWNQWSRKRGPLEIKNGAAGSDMASILSGAATQASPSVVRCTEGRHRGVGFATINSDDAGSAAAHGEYGSSPLVGIKSSASAPVIDRQQVPAGRTRDGQAIDRHASDLHLGKPWRKGMPRPDYLPPAPKHASDLHDRQRRHAAAMARRLLAVRRCRLNTSG